MGQQDQYPVRLQPDFLGKDQTVVHGDKRLADGITRNAREPADEFDEGKEKLDGSPRRRRVPRISLPRSVVKTRSSVPSRMHSGDKNQKTAGNGGKSRMNGREPGSLDPPDDNKIPPQ